MTARDKEGPQIMIKTSVQQEYVTLVNIFATNTEANKTKKKIDNNTIIRGEFTIPPTSTDRSSMQKKLTGKQWL